MNPLAILLITTSTTTCPTLPETEVLEPQAQAVACVLEKCAKRLAQKNESLASCEDRLEVAQGSLREWENYHTAVLDTPPSWMGWAGPGLVGVGLGFAGGGLGTCIGTSDCNPRAALGVALVSGTAGVVLWLVHEVTR